MTFWLIIGSQSMYGDKTISEVEANGRTMVRELDAALPHRVVYKGVVLSGESAVDLMKAANFDDGCAGIITFCHTFSPSKMWIAGLGLLQKPWCHLHTQFNLEIPDSIDMDYMNLHQGAHGDREHGYLGARMHLARKVVAGHWRNPLVVERLGRWQRACVGAAVSKGLKVVRFGDNMREVAVTDGDKVGAQMRFGWRVNTTPVGALVEAMGRATEAEVDQKIDEYRQHYDFGDADPATVRYQALEELAIGRILEAAGASAFSNTFEDLYGLRQLPGLATQNLMAKGYGYAGEGDWKTAALTAMVKRMGARASFMEDYTYDLAAGLSLGAHMLEVCPTIASSRPRIEVHHLGIGDREPPARLVFEGAAGPAVVLTMIDMGGRFRLIAQDVACVEPTKRMPSLPVARVMWKPHPSLEVGAECWIMAGGGHHTVLAYDLDQEILRDWARIMGVEYLRIGAETTAEAFEERLRLSETAWRYA